MVFFLTMLAALLLSGERIFGKLATSCGDPNIFRNPVYGLLLMQAAMIIFGALNWLFSAYILKQPMNFNIPTKGIIFFLLAGLVVGAFDFLMLVVFKGGATASYFTPLVAGGQIVFAVLLGMLFLGETLTGIQIFSVLLIVAGVMLFNLDPAAIINVVHKITAFFVSHIR
jgi:uncharacterized membrane protein